MDEEFDLYGEEFPEESEDSEISLEEEPEYDDSD